MAEKFSPKLKKLIEVGNADEIIDLTVMLESGLPADLAEKSMRQVESIVGSPVKFVSISGTLHAHAPLRVAASIEQVEHVERIDVEARAALEDLLDF